ncbi:SNF2 family N-terminal domain-containing protein [Russula brevipes]|nr:SNF2 family N-terminal domain-containing protein [Russula brevipes]
MPFPNGIKGAIAKVMNTIEMCRKRSAESDGGDLPVSTRPAIKKRAVMKAGYTETPIWAVNPRDKGRDRPLSNFVDGLEDEFVLDSGASPEFDKLVALQGEPDGDGSDINLAGLDFEDNKERYVTLRHSQEAVDILGTAKKASIRYIVDGGASTSADPTSRNALVGAAVAATANRRFVMGQGSEVDSKEVPSGDDSEDGVLVSTYQEGEYIVQRRTGMDEDRGRNQGQERSEYDADGNYHDYLTARSEVGHPTSLEREEMGTLEYQLSRRLTHVGLASNVYMPNHTPVIGLGQALTRILQFSSALAAEDRKALKLRLSHWENLVEEFFTPLATLKLTLWKDNQKEEAKVFEVGTPVLPRFFLVTSQSGVKSMRLSLDGARERAIGPNQAIVQCVSATWTYRYHNGYTVTLRGPFTAHVAVTPDAGRDGAPAQPVHRTPTLKIDSIRFDSNLYEKQIAVDVIGGNRLDNNESPQVRDAPTSSPTLNTTEPQIAYERAFIPAEPVNAFGIPQATMRCLELAESIAQMTNLILYSFDKRIGPLDALRQYAQQIREVPIHLEHLERPYGMAVGPSAHSLSSPITLCTGASSAQIPSAAISQSASSSSPTATNPFSIPLEAKKFLTPLHQHHPELRDAWGDLEATVGIVEPQKAEQPSRLRVTLLPFQRESLHWMRKQESGHYAGGLLADEMGMGKTIQMIALMVSGPTKPNLVVAPTVAIMHWRNEIETHATGMDVLVWHGASRMTNPEDLKKYDAVLTTYAVLESCFRKQQTGFTRKGTIIKENSPLHAVEWERVVLDEAHNIKERATNTAKATFSLMAKYRWCLSGTPLQNRVGELYSLIRFLGCDPFSHYYCKTCDCKSLHWKFSDKRTCDDCGHSPMVHMCFWNNEILIPIQKHGMQGSGAIAFKKLRILLARIMLRRTKTQRADDLGLPPRTVVVRRDSFSPEEKELYLSLFSDAKRQFSTYVDAGTLLNNYSNIFSLITRMRQMACHPDLVIRGKNNAGVFGDEEGEATMCRLCNDIAEDAIKAKCRHIFDRECIKQYLSASIEEHPTCPVCHLALRIDVEAPALELEMPATARQGILGRLNVDTWRSSSKIEALVEELSNLRNQDATTKSIVFSQFVNFLDLIAFRLQRIGFSICRLEGTMSPQARDATIQHFMSNVHVTVFLVSLKAGGVALNLTEASRVYLMDSWWNPAAMDRIHRLGQRRPVQAIKLVIEDSIESRIVQLQEKKSAMVDATLSTDDSAMGRLTPADLSFLFRVRISPIFLNLPQLM